MVRSASLNGDSHTHVEYTVLGTCVLGRAGARSLGGVSRVRAAVVGRGAQQVGRRGRGVRGRGRVRGQRGGRAAVRAVARERAERGRAGTAALQRVLVVRDQVRQLSHLRHEITYIKFAL